MLRLVLRDHDGDDAAENEDLVVAKRGTVKGMRRMAISCGCVGALEEGMLLATVDATDRSNEGTSPDKRFAPVPKDLALTEFRVVQVWGLRHCVMAASARLIGHARQQVRQPLGAVGAEVLSKIKEVLQHRAKKFDTGTVSPLLHVLLFLLVLTCLGSLLRRVLETGWYKPAYTHGWDRPAAYLDNGLNCSTFLLHGDRALIPPQEPEDVPKPSVTMYG